MNSLERSLQFGLVVSLTLLMLVFWWAGSLTSRLLAQSFVYQDLEADASALVDALTLDSPGRVDPLMGSELIEGKLDAAYEQPASGRYYVLRFSDGQELISRSAWGQSLDIPSLAPAVQQRARTLDRAGEPLMLWLGGFAKSGREFTVATLQSYAPIRDRLVIFQWYFALIGVLLLIALATVQHLVVRRSVARLDAIRSDMLRLEHGQIDSLTEEVPAEIRPLVKEFNRLLRRFDQRLRQSRNAVGNLAHALKGPLNLLLRVAEDDHARTRDRDIVQNAERIHQLIESELRRARLAGHSAAGRRFDLDAEIPHLIGLLDQVYSDKQVDVRYQVGPDVSLMHDRQDMLELIGNLLDNAVKWASGTVIMSVRRADGLLLEVDDDGPGVPESQLRRLTERGVRLDESVSGHGLGLSIVRDIVDIYDGTLTLGASNRLGGLRVSVWLPDARADIHQGEPGDSPGGGLFGLRRKRVTVRPTR